MLRAPLTITLGAALLLLAAPTVNAMGFGRTATGTTLGQPLNFSAAILLDSSETLARGCVSAEVHAGDVRVPAANVRVSIEAGEGNGRSVRVTTSTPIDEPVVTVEITVGCNSFLSRRFVAFVDPPLLNLAETPSAKPAPPPQRTASDAVPILDIVRAADAERRRPRDRRVAAADVATRPAATPRDRTSGPTRAGARPGGSAFATATARGGPRLRLETPPPTLAAASSPLLPPAVVADAAPAGAASSPAAAGSSPIAVQSTAEAATDALSRERERIQQLEATMAKLGSDARAMQQSVATLQAKLRQAESDRYSSTLVFALAAGLVFFALLAVALWALRPRQRQRARWFDANANQQARAKRNPAPAVASAPPPSPSRYGDAPGAESWTRGPPSVLPVTAPATIGGLEVTTVLGPDVTRPITAATTPAPLTAAPPAAAGRSGSLSMEELIDLEQQAEFFVVLGQDEAAIELLAAHIREGGGVSPLPYLKLLEIHQRRRDAQAYERVRGIFRERFNAFAPEWSTDLHYGRVLEAYPQTVARLQALWPTPMRAMQTLDSLLFRRNEADEAFDFPACRDLLFLYSIARELAGNVETDFGSIDLLLPLEETTATPDSDSQLLDLDVSADNLVIRRSPGRLGAG